MKTQKTDWVKIKTEYITGRMSYRCLAENHGISYSTLEKRAKQEGWVTQRKAYCGEVAENLIQKIAESEVDGFVIELAAINKTSKILHNAVMDKEFFFRHKVNGNQVCVLKAINVRTLTDTVEAFAKLVNLKMRLYGIIGEKERLEMELEREKFEHQKQMDLKRLELMQQRVEGMDEECDYGVVLIPARLGTEKLSQ